MKDKIIEDLYIKKHLSLSSIVIGTLVLKFYLEKFPQNL